MSRRSQHTTVKGLKQIAQEVIALACAVEINPELSDCQIDCALSHVSAATSALRRGDLESVRDQLIGLKAAVDAIAATYSPEKKQEDDNV